MTVSYSETISSSQGGVFIKILALWKGSLYKLVYTDLLAYLVMYYVFNLSYRFILSAEGRQNFELVVRFCDEMDKSIPLSFILGFFVAGVIARWWEMYLHIPWMNRVAFFAYGILTGQSETFETARRIRMSMMRYMNLGWILLMHSISEQIMHRFSGAEADAKQQQQQQQQPDDTEYNGAASTRSRLMYWLYRLRGMNQLTAELRAASKKVQEEKGVRGLLENINKCPGVKLHFNKLVTEAEIQAFERVEGEYQVKYQRRYVPDYWLPLQWAALLTKKAMMHGFCDPRSMVMLMEEIEDVRGMMQTLIIYNDVMIPLVYTQVVIIAVYSYFLLQLFSQQFVNPKQTAWLLNNKNNSSSFMPISIGNKDNHGEVIDMYFPVFTIFQFLFLMGWLKVAMCVMNPFGDDDEDFHTSGILDYNLEISSRCAEAPSIFFPEGLSEPSMEWIRKSQGHETDGLLAYLDAAELEFQNVSPPDPDEMLKPFTMEKSTGQKVQDFVCCSGDDAGGEHSQQQRPLVRRSRYTEPNGKNRHSANITSKA